MELIKEKIHMDHCQELAYTQISLEEDQNISDQKPDALRVICKKADVRIGETKVLEDSVLIKGVLCIRCCILQMKRKKDFAV